MDIESRPYKIIVVGDPMVGKTSFVNSYVFDEPVRNYKQTIGVDFALKVLQWSDSVKVKLQMWDIAGQERFTSMTRVYYKDAHACVIMFDLTQRSSFDNAARWKKDLDSKCTLADGSSIPCMLIANKCDLHAQREVDQESIETFIKEHDFIGWTETSVKTGSMVDESMKFLVDELMKCYGEEEEPVPQSANITLRSEDDIRKKDKSKCSC